MTALAAAPRTRRSQEQRSAETRERLIVAAIECIERVGYVEATTTLIAQQANVSRGALQHHFATKADLIVAVIDRVSEELNLRFDVPDAFDAFDRRDDEPLARLGAALFLAAPDARESR